MPRIRGAYDFVDVRDVANGLILAAEKGQSGRNYILSGAQVQVTDLMKELERDYPGFRNNIFRARLL